MNNELGGLFSLKALQKPLQEKIMEIAAQVLEYDKKTQHLVNEIEEFKCRKWKSKQKSQIVIGNYYMLITI